LTKLYALSTCPWCKKTRELLDSTGEKYEAVDVDLLEGEALNKALAEIDSLVSRRAFPIVVIGRVVIQSYQPQRILEELNRARAS
jgi:glutaredoxin